MEHIFQAIAILCGTLLLAALVEYSGPGLARAVAIRLLRYSCRAEQRQTERRAKQERELRALCPAEEA